MDFEGNLLPDAIHPLDLVLVLDSSHRFMKRVLISEEHPEDTIILDV